MSDRQVGVELLAEGFKKPTNSAVAPGDPDALYVSDQFGPLWRVELRDGSKQMVADLSGLLVPVGLKAEGVDHLPDERGFLGLAFHPDFERNGLLYTHTSEPPDSGEPTFPSTLPSGERADHLGVLREWTVQRSADGTPSLDVDSSRVLFSVAEPQWNHNGGELVFGPDGMLYVQLGDGGGADDQNEQLWWTDPDDDGTYTVGPIVGHLDGGNAQDLSVPLGKILRVDVDGRGAPHGEYGVPADNPFVGVDGALGEIWAYGLRNPFQGSIDRATGDYWVGDVGQNDVEEVDVIQRGGNYGWNVREGSFWFAPRDFEQGSGTVVEEPVQPVPPELVDPVAQYDHDWGVAVIGGYVYRGPDQPALQGQYVFGDHHGGKLLVHSAEDPARQLRIAGSENNELGYSLTAFAEDAHGELYVMGTPHEGSGRIERIVPAGTDGMVAPVPRGGVAAGAGGAADDDAATTVAGVAALGGAAVLAGVGIARRRTAAR
ncbi:PQQ-dependent sugar dehydrogenase [Blastococcus goldschmidtiae]|uniref:PQQ-dependent sugar dehydrogenase n=1 Tax=Blastococcus goldschmidtiae TaxID=3075546 RepID=A0ABU2K706_9ACTN|nr:PQQ-dependent sugar dehydrogenase [Blastococcus sp. DSM 46792]MDT0275969.1 PQQ-dependent sugar dehydrogenase [Blastococcus sp. DSM 46792]